MDTFSKVAMLRDLAEIPKAIPTSDALEVIGTQIGITKLTLKDVEQLSEDDLRLYVKAIVLEKKVQELKQ